MRKRTGTIVKTTLGTAMAALALNGCEHDVGKTFESGGRIEAKVTAEKCPDAGVAAPIQREPRDVRGECKVYGDGDFSAFAKMHVTKSAGAMPEAPHDEVWHLGCLRGQCELARMDADTLVGHGPVERYSVSAWRGSVVSRAGNTFKISVAGMADQGITIDLTSGSLSYRQVFKAGDIVTAAGTCNAATIGDNK